MCEEQPIRFQATISSGYGGEIPIFMEEQETVNKYVELYQMQYNDITALLKKQSTKTFKLKVSFQ